MSDKIMQHRVLEALKEVAPEGLTLDDLAFMLGTSRGYIRDVIRGLTKNTHPKVRKNRLTRPAKYHWHMPKIEIEYSKLAKLQVQLLESIAIVNSIPNISED